jgi:hypothetical protein
MSVIHLSPSDKILNLIECVDVLYKRHVLGEPQRQLPTTLDSENNKIKLVDSEKRIEKVSL